jgi:peptidyl-prolyl cis-trans isomerase D
MGYRMLLEKFRSMSKTWVAKVILAAITIPFALFGVEYYFRQGGGGADTVAKVDGYSITQAEFNETLRSQQEQLRANNHDQPLDPASLDTPQLRAEVLDALINRHLATGYANHAKIVIPDHLLVSEISRIEPFQDNGHFSQARYEEALRARGLVPALFESRLRDDLKNELVQEGLVTTDWVPQVSVNAFLTLSGQQREVSVTEITPETFLDRVKVDDATIQKYYDSHLDRFKVGERVKVQYLVLSADQLSQSIEVSAADVAKAYADPVNKDRWGGQETRRASHILILAAPKATDAERAAARALAQKALAEVTANPSQFAALAKKYSQDPGSASGGGDLGYFGRGAMTPAFENAVFALKPNQVSGIVETEFGFHIIRLTDVKTAKGKTLAEATPEITAELRKQRVGQRFSETAENFSNLVYEQSASLKPAAERLKLTLKDSGWVTRAGQAPDPLLNNPKLIAALFAPESVKNGRNTQAIEVSPNVLVAAHVTLYEPPTARPLSEVGPVIFQLLRREEAGKLAAQEGAARLVDLQAGKSVGFKWSAARRFNRQDALGSLPAGLVDDVFKANPNHLPSFVGSATGNGSYVIAQVTAVVPGAITDTERRKQAETGLARGYGDEVMAEFLAALRTDGSFRLVNKALLEKQKQN